MTALAASSLIGGLLLAVGTSAPAQAEAAASTAPVQAPYYAGWEQASLPPASLPWSKMTHVIHFSVLPTATGGLNDTTNGLTAANARALVDEAHSRGKKVLFAVGGTPGSESWPAAASSANRARFVSNLVSFMSERRYDGIDLNWEGGINNADYLATMKALRQALDSRGRGELLTAAVFGSWTELARAAWPLLDWVTMMSYLPYGQPAKSHNSPIYGTAYARIDNLVKAWLLAGVPPSKIVFGLATYASVWVDGKLVTPELPYRDAVARGYTSALKWDSNAQASFFTSGTTFVSMDNDASVKAKAAYRLARGLRGMVVWELGAGRVGSTVPLAASLPSVDASPTTAPTTTAAPTAAATARPIKIVKIFYDSPGTDTGSNASINAEHVILKNTTSVARVITGYRLRDVAGHTYVLGATRLAPGGTVTIRTGRGTSTATTRYWQRSSYVWNNTKDTAYLISSTGAVVHACSYPDTTAQFKAC